MQRYIFLILLIPISVGAQRSIGAKKLIDDKVCDTCKVRIIQNLGEVISYMIIDAQEVSDFTTTDVNKSANNSFPNVSKYIIASRAFTLDFILDDLPETNPGKENLKRQRLQDLPLQFIVLSNKQIIKDWTNIDSLSKDRDFQPFQLVKGNKEEIPFDNYHAGRFQLNVNDSLVLLIRNGISKQIVESIIINRVPVFPNVFKFIKFSSDQDLQTILNDKINSGTPQEIRQDNHTNNYEIRPNETVLIKVIDPAVQRNEVEYAFTKDPGSWKTLTASNDPFLSYSYILINNPGAGATTELLLRYKYQKESIYHIKIKVGEKVTSTTWFKITMTLISACLLFVIWYRYKRKNNLKHMRQLMLAKEEIESKLQLLSGQLNPHFLFNSLNSLQNLINKNDTENANKYLSEVSLFLRTIMSIGKKEYISLQEELSIEEVYMKLEQKRKYFTYTLIYNCSTDLSQVEFPPSLLQPVIENSIHHGFYKDLQNPNITIRINCNERQLTVLVEDNGQGFSQASISPGHGLSMVEKRIALINEKLRDVSIKMNIGSTDKGTVTTFIFENWL